MNQIQKVAIVLVALTITLVGATLVTAPLALTQTVALHARVA